MKKISIFLILSTLLTTCFAAGCKNDRELPSYLGPVEEIFYEGSLDCGTFLRAPDGKAVLTTEITSLSDKKYEPVNILKEDDFGEIVCEGFAFAFEPKIYIDKESDPEKFNEDYYIGKDEISSDFIRVKVGDRFGGLTVKSARTVFHGLYEDTAYYQGSEFELEGEIKLKGKLSIPSVDPKYPNVELDMSLQCGNESKLPLSPDFGYSEELGFCHSPSSGWGVYTDIPEIKLGTLSDCDTDLCGLGQGDRAVVEATLKNVKMVCGIQGISCCVLAELVDIALV